ncbi:hypothetical protein Syun_000801 [Stephania yunnanensis]|uniref:Gag protein n=1 Tax=Stephania yunnanensis TaxID=152371 RepID=A0AAP0LCX2_9MAGN
MKQYSDSLATVGFPFATTDLISCTLAGLDGEYLPITSLLQEKEDLAWLELQASLLSFETKLQQLHNIQALSSISINSPSQSSSTASNPSAHLTQHKPFSGHNRSGQNNSYRGRGGATPGQGRGGGRYHSSNNKPFCQICGKVSHTTTICYYRNDSSYMGSVPAPPSQPQLHPLHNTPTSSAFIASPPSMTDGSWYFDSGC